MKQGTYDELKNRIKECRVVTFDFYNTLVLRDIPYPDFLFSIIEYEKKIKRFYKHRISAENKAKRLIGDNKYSLSDIYNNLDFKGYNKLDLMNFECEMEVKYAVLNKEITPLLEYCMQLGKDIYIISDMYLPSSIEEKILGRYGIVPSAIFVSAEHKKSKSKGDFYQYLADKMNWDCSAVLHIGDDYESDFINAQKAGWHSYLYKEMKHTLLYKEKIVSDVSKALLRRGIIFYSGRDISDIVLSCFLKNRITKNSIDYRIGFELIGPLVYCFINELHRYCNKNNIRKILFNARDTKYIMQSYEKVFGENAIPYMYFRFSRKIVNQILNLEDKESNVITYLKKNDIKGKIALVDLGWTGVSASVLDQYCAANGLEIDPRIFYFAVDLNANSRYLEQHLDYILLDKYSRTMHIYILTTFLETIMSERGGSCIGYNCCGEPILGEKDDYDDALEKIHEGIVEFCEMYSSAKYELLDTDYLQDGLLWLSENPSQRVLDAIKMCGRNHEPLIEWDKKKILKSIMNSSWKGGYFNSRFSAFSRFIFKLYYYFNSIFTLCSGKRINNRSGI